MSYNNFKFPLDVITNAPYGSRRIETNSLGFRDYIIARGHGFTSEYEFDIPVGGKDYLLFTNNSSDYIAVTDRKIITNQEDLRYRIYNQFTLTGSPSNGSRNVNLKTDSNVQIPYSLQRYPEAQVSNLSDIITVDYVFGSINAGNRGNGVITNQNAYRFIGPNKQLLVEFENGSIDAIQGQVVYVFAYIPASSVFDGLGPQANY